jgi:hypothetical protein
MPQARSAHQPRNASNNTKPPHATIPTPNHIDTPKANHAPIKNINAPNPRKSLPLLLMLGEKIGFMAV